MEAAGIWLRVSTTGQDEENQQPAIMRWVTDHRYQVTKTYMLHGASASKGQQQKKLDEMLTDMRHGEIKVLIVWASDRIERRGAYSAFDLAEKVRQAGGRIEYVKDTYLNTVNEMSDVMLALAATKDKMESKRKTERSEMTVETIRSNGAFFGRAPWGYTPVGTKYNKQLIPTEDGRKFIPEIYRRVIKGESLDDIGRWLKQETGKSWWARTIGAMIRNTAYMGYAADESGRTVHECEPLVDASTFKLAGESLDSRPKRGPMRVENKAMLAGAIYCSQCDSPMYKINCGNRRKDGTKVDNWYYRCAGVGPQRKGCGNMVSLVAVDAAAENLMNKWDRPIMTRTLIPGHDWSAEIADVEFKLSRLGMQGLSEEEEDTERARLRTEKRRLQALPAVPAAVEWVERPETYWGEWRQLAAPQRGGFLCEHGFTVYADKSEVVLQSDHGVTLREPL